MTRMLPIRILLLSSVTLLAGCAGKTPPPEISLDEPYEASRIVEPAGPVEIVELPKPLPLPGQLKPMPVKSGTVEPADPKLRVTTANDAARVQPTRTGYVNATQVWPYMAGALYQVYAAPEKVTDIALQSGEELISVSAGDTVRWVIGDTTSGGGGSQQTHILVKPTRPDLKTNLVVNTNRRTYLLELTSTPQTWMASVSWDYPHDRLLALQRQNDRAGTATPVANAVALERVQFRYEITGDNPSWRPTRVFDDGEKVYIQFPAGIAQGELPPLFVVGPTGENQLVNYRAKPPYYIVDRLFGAAELRLGGEKQQIVRISRTDGNRRGIFGL
ncbi:MULTISPECIES: P-type conjugative transfer protein TrbG [Hyphomicrobiales]|uniref:Type IV secretion system protein VirB9 n=1 Tax=Chelatococcus asaccharovorans TaxID=28210 RepID=A0A2V3UGE2_9HYPH|nr:MULTISPECIES: P-type conjugative transfer protein TrbG [Hyphomicrobiales]MBS7701981.1 P-type conjugative transfer protein TrbG [Chelatococcus asaccharovorans]PXW64311.1 type IV secretion system protein VirB9 [Chelatococcus asaccharovorans]